MDRKQAKTVAKMLFIVAMTVLVAGLYVRSSIRENGPPRDYSKADTVAAVCAVLAVVVGGSGFYVKGTGE